MYTKTMGSSLICTSILFFAFLQYAGVAAQQCHTGWKIHGSSCYLFVKQLESWSEAMGHCRAIGGTLAEIMTDEENTFLQSTLLKQYQNDSSKAQVRYWLGGTDIAQEGYWEWVNSDQPFDYTNWHPGQPDNALSNENCLEMTGHMNFDWNDMICTLKFYFICQRELEVVIG